MLYSDFTDMLRRLIYCCFIILLFNRQVRVCVMSGYEATDTVHIVNGESEPMQFTFVEASCHAAGYTVSLTVEPMHGTVPAKSRFISHEFIISTY